MDEYVQKFASLTHRAGSINSVTDPSNACSVKFKFHDLPQKRSCILGNHLPDSKSTQPSKSKHALYGGNKVSHFGTVKLPCECNGKKLMCDFFICDIEGSILLGLPTCETSNIVKINIVDNEENVANVDVQEVTYRSNGYID